MLTSGDRAEAKYRRGNAPRKTSDTMMMNFRSNLNDGFCPTAASEPDVSQRNQWCWEPACTDTLFQAHREKSIRSSQLHGFPRRFLQEERNWNRQSAGMSFSTRKAEPNTWMPSRWSESRLPVLWIATRHWRFTEQMWFIAKALKRMLSSGTFEEGECLQWRTLNIE